MTIRPATASNSPPTADAGSNATVASGVDVGLDATDSSDPDGDSLAYEWAQTGGPSVELESGGTATPSFTAPVVSTPTTLTFAVAVADGQTNATDTVSVTVQPPAPSSSERVDRTLGSTRIAPGETVSVTLTYETASARGAVSIQDDFEGPVSAVSLTAIRINGTEAPDDSVVVGIGSAADGVSIALQDIGTNATISVRYTATVSAEADDGDVVRFVGRSDRSDVSAGEFAAEFGTDIAITAGGVLERFDGNGNGVIDTVELQAAIEAWAQGRLSTSALETVIQAWATGG